MKDLKLCEGAQLQLCHKTNKNQLRALQAAEKLARAVGRGFIPGLKSIKSTWALAPAVRFSSFSLEIWRYSAASLARGKSSIGSAPTAGCPTFAAAPPRLRWDSSTYL